MSACNKHSRFIWLLWLIPWLALGPSSCGIHINDNCLHPDADCFVEDTTAPRLISSDPPTGVPTDDISRITLTFSERLPSIDDASSYSLATTSGIIVDIVSVEKNSPSEVVLVTNSTLNSDAFLALDVSLHDYNGNVLEESFDYILDLTPPEIEVNAAPGDGRLALTISLADSSATSIRVYRSQGGFQDELTGQPIYETTLAANATEDAQFSETGLTNGSGYFYQVVAEDAIGLQSEHRLWALPGIMEYRYAVNGSGWNQYVLHDDIDASPDAFSASGAACTSPAGRYSKCIHGGEMHMLQLPGRTTCPAGLRVRDNLRAFRWTCRDGTHAETNPMQLISWRLHTNKGLADLIDWSQNPPVWRDVHVTWSEELCGDNECVGPGFNLGKELRPAEPSGNLNNPNVIYYYSAAMANGPGEPTINLASGATIVVQPGTTYAATGSAQALDASGNSFTWVEGKFANNGLNNIVTLGDWSVGKNLVLTVPTGSDPLLQMGTSVLLVNSKTWTSASLNACYLSPASDYISIFHSRGDQCHISLSETGAGTLLFQTTFTQSGLTLGDNSFSFLGLFAAHTQLTLNGDGAGLVASTLTHSDSDPVTVQGNGSEGVFMHNQLWANNDGDVNALGATGNPELLYGLISVENQRVIHGTPGPTTYLYDELVFGNISGPLCGVGNCQTDLGTTFNTDYTIDSNGVNGLTLFAGDASDSVNPSATSGSSPVPALNLNHGNFENRFRAWILADGGYPSQNERGPCVNSESADCRIFDFSLAIGDSGNGNSPLALGIHPVPDGNDFFISRHAAPSQADCDALDGTWEPTTFNANPPYSLASGASSGCANLALKYAVEFPDDGFGDEDGFCETNEFCLYTPNAGAYQGHFNAPEENCADPYFHVGSVWCRESFTGGTLSGITLLRYDQNGR